MTKLEKHYIICDRKGTKFSNRINKELLQVHLKKYNYPTEKKLRKDTNIQLTAKYSM